MTAYDGSAVVNHADNVNNYLQQRRPRRSRVLSVVLPAVLALVLAGAVLVGIDLAPHRSAAAGAGSPSPSAPPSRSAKPSPSGTPAAARHSPAPGAFGVPAPGPGPRTAPVAPGPGHTGSAGQAPPAHTRAASLSIGSEVRLQDVGTRECANDNGTVYAAFGACATSDAYLWTLLSAGGGTFELVNRATRNCLALPTYGTSAIVGYCSGMYGDSGSVYWQLGSATAAGRQLRSRESGKCLEIAAPYDGNPEAMLAATCDSGRTRQMWKNAG